MPEPMVVSELGLMEWGREVDVVKFYTHRYRGNWRFSEESDFIVDVQWAANDVWYELGLFEKYGCDYFGIKYRQIDDQWGDSRWGYGAMIERDNENLGKDR